MNDTDTPLALTTAQVALIRQAARRLSTEFDGTFNTETIERYITDSQTKLCATARIATWMPVLVERFTRDRLRALARLETGDLSTPAVLFLCVHNSGRSQMAAGWLRHLAGDRIEVFSGGSDPGDDTNAKCRHSNGRGRHRHLHRIPKTLDRRDRPSRRHHHHDGLRRRLPDLSRQTLRRMGPTRPVTTVNRRGAFHPRRHPTARRKDDAQPRPRDHMNSENRSSNPTMDTQSNSSRSHHG